MSASKGSARIGRSWKRFEKEQIWLLTRNAESELGWVVCEEPGEQGGLAHARWTRQHQWSEEIRGDGRGGHRKPYPEAERWAGGVTKIGG